MFRRCIAAAALALAAIANLAHAQAPRVTTSPERPTEQDNVVLTVQGEFPRGDFELAGIELKSINPVMTLLPTGMDEFSAVVTVRYRWNADGVGTTVMKPYSGQVPIGRFARVSRIHLTLEYTPVGSAPSEYFREQPYQRFLFIDHVAPPRVTVETKEPSTADSVRLTLRFYDVAVFKSIETTHAVEGNVIRVRQSATVDPVADRFFMAENTVSYELGKLAAGSYTIEFLQSVGGQPHRLLGTAPLTVKAATQACSKNHYILIRMEKCQAGAAGLTGETLSHDFGTVTLGQTAGPVDLTLERSEPGELEIRRIWVNNLDYIVTHDCPLAPQRLGANGTCRVSVRFAGTLLGVSPGRLEIRYFNTNTGAEEAATAVLTGTVITEGGVNFSPAPIIATGTAVEYHLGTRDQYFTTTDAREKLTVDAGEAGPWARTGVTFPVGGNRDVCRFYGDLAAGPRSHFYTVRVDECEQLKALDRATPIGQRAFRYEGIAFQSESTDVWGNAGTATTRPWCDPRSSRRPVYRLYNGGFERGIDSNHRFIPSAGTFPAGKTGEDIVRDMLARGWIYEGHAFCNS